MPDSAHAINNKKLGKARDIVAKNVGFRSGREVEAWKARQRQATSTGGVNPSLRNSDPEADNEEKGQTRDIVAKIISWGTGAINNPTPYPLLLFFIYNGLLIYHKHSVNKPVIHIMHTTHF